MSESLIYSILAWVCQIIIAVIIFCLFCVRMHKRQKIKDDEKHKAEGTSNEELETFIMDELSRETHTILKF